MNGMAGTGKTTIAYSLSEMLDKDCQLGASFFCSRLVPNCRDVNNIIPTIAYQLADFSYPFRSALCDELDRSRDIGSYDLDTQFDKLVKGPLLNVKDSMPKNVVVVIDALDESSDASGTRLILDLLFRYAAEMPVKFFVTSRPEPAINNKMLSQDNTSRSIMILHEVARGAVRADIEAYLSSELAVINPSGDEIRQLAEQADNLFIYAATAVRYICPENLLVNSHQRLKTMLGMSSKATTTNKHREIDTLYNDIVASALEHQGWEPWEAENMKLVLHTIVCLCEPITSEEMASLLRLDDVSEVQLALEHLRSVLHVSESTGLISALHASFPDYILSEQRSGRFFCNEAKHHKILALRCFDIMKGSLRFNICDLESSHVLDRDVPEFDARVNKAITPQLTYACQYWGNHLSRTEPSHELRMLLHEFLSVRLLFWVEVIGVKRRCEAGDSTLFHAHTWLKVIFPNAYPY
jgi:hypothetical protein